MVEQPQRHTEHHDEHEHNRLAVATTTRLLTNGRNGRNIKALHAGLRELPAPTSADSHLRQGDFGLDIVSRAQAYGTRREVVVLVGDLRDGRIHTCDLRPRGVRGGEAGAGPLSRTQPRVKGPLAHPLHSFRAVG